MSTFIAGAFDARSFLRGATIGIPDAGLCLRRLGLGDFHALLAFRAEVIASLSDADFIHEEPNESDFVGRILEPDNLITSVWDATRLVAWSGLVCPSSRVELDSYHIGSHVTARADIRQSAYIAGTMVHVDYRGLGLQNYMTFIRNEAVSLMGRTHHFATAAYGNHFSWGNAIRNGFRVVDALSFHDVNYGRLNRMFMYRPPWPEAVEPGCAWLAANDIRNQERICAAGFMGTRWRLEDGGAEIGFQKRSASPGTDGPDRRGLPESSRVGSAHRGTAV